MAKINKYTWKIQGENINSKEFDVVIEYRTDLGFYVKLPEDFKETIHTLGVDGRIKYEITLISRGRDQGTYIICNPTEYGCIELGKSIFRKLLDLTIIETSVIIVDFKNGYEKSHYNKAFPHIGLTFELHYVVEKKCGNTAKYYYKNNEKHYLSGQMEITYSELRLESHKRNKYKILPDTSENRIYLEDLYNRLSEFVQKVEAVVTTNQLLLNIENHVKLLE